MEDSLEREKTGEYSIFNIICLAHNLRDLIIKNRHS